MTDKLRSSHLRIHYMINKNFDHVIIGKNYLSLLYALELMKNGKSILLIDDGKTQLGEDFESSLSQVELNFIEIWLEDLGLKHLAQLLRNDPQFSTVKQYRFIFGGRHLILGENPSRNFVEIVRKLNNCFNIKSELIDDSSFNADDFDSSFVALCRRLSQVCYHFRGVENFSPDEFLSHYPRPLKEAFIGLVKSWHEIEHQNLVSSASLRSFYYGSRAFFHQLLENQISDGDLFYLFLSLLSSRYQINTTDLSNLLLNEFAKQGGSFKRTTVREWLFEKSRPWAMELSSYEGIVHPKTVCFFGGKLDHLPLRFDVNGEIFRGVYFKIQYTDLLIDGLECGRDDFEHLQGPSCCISNWGELNEGQGLFRFNFINDGIEVLTSVNLKKGSKIEFYRGAILEALIRHLRAIYPGIEHKSKDDIELIETSDVWGRRNKIHPKVSVLSEDVKILDHTTPLASHALKDIHYFGPVQMGGQGLLSTLMCMRENALFQ